MFPYASIDQYVVLDIVNDLSALTTCLWIRTSDKNNYGTIFSYAAENNLLGPAAGNDFTLYNYGGLKVMLLVLSYILLQKYICWGYGI